MFALYRIVILDCVEPETNFSRYLWHFSYSIGINFYFWRLMVWITERKQNKWNETNPMFDARSSTDVHQSVYTHHLFRSLPLWESRICHFIACGELNRVRTENGFFIVCANLSYIFHIFFIIIIILHFSLNCFEYVVFWLHSSNTLNKLYHKQ